MPPAEILAAVGEVLAAVFDKPGLRVTEATTAKDIPEWDSLNNIHVVVAVEKRFKVRFTTAEIRGWKTVGEMCAAIGRRLGG